MTSDQPEWSGIYAAIPTPFDSQGAIDDPGLRSYLDWLSRHRYLTGVVTGAHAGEVTNLTPAEMAAISQISVESFGDRGAVVPALFAEGVAPAAELVTALTATGADGILVMPPHHWLRFGKTPDESLAYVRGVADATDLPLIIHEYPAGTRAGYSTEELLAFAEIPTVVAVKAGTRELSAYKAHIEALREHAPHVAILNCHDEAMLPTLVQRVDGILVAAGSLFPDELGAMHEAISAGDLNRAWEIEARLAPVMSTLYGGDQPNGYSHALLKAALHVLKALPDATVRPPVPQVSDEDYRALTDVLTAAGFTTGR